MDKLEESSNNQKLGFIQHVFKFEDEDKGHMLNLVQYTILAIVPIILILKFMKVYIPEFDENKGSPVVLAEVVGQVLFMLFSIYFIHKVIIYIPTYSGFKYNDFNMINFILAFLMLLFTMNTRIGEKVQLLVERVYDLYSGNESLKSQKNNKQGGNVKVSQPLAPQLQPNIPNQTPTQPNLNPQMPTQQSPDFNSYYQGPTTPLVNANTPSQEAMMNPEPVAANDFGGGFGTPF